MWFSHKFKGPGLRYIVSIAIHTGDIVHVGGPYPCGAWSDLRIAREEIVPLMNAGEKAIADRGYRDDDELRPAS